MNLYQVILTYTNDKSTSKKFTSDSDSDNKDVAYIQNDLQYIVFLQIILAGKLMRLLLERCQNYFFKLL